jgi:SnoaL-like domain
VSADDVRATVMAVAHDIDSRKWNELQELFAPTVAVDYTSLFGGAVSQSKAAELVGGWRTALEGVTTQHLLGPIDVRIRGDAADARCHVRALHYRASARDGDTWEVLGHYVFALALQRRAWRITAMRLDTYHQLGNRSLLSAT